MFGQLIISGIGTGLIVALPAIALSLTFGILRFPNFAIGAMLTFAAYMAWVLNVIEFDLVQVHCADRWLVNGE